MADCPPDSPLSTTGNIIGLLTFALGLFSFCAAFYAITHNAVQEIDDYEKSLAERKAHIAQIRQYIEDADVVADAELEGNPIKDLIFKALDDLEARRRTMERDIYGVGGRLQWWYRRQDMAIAMARIEAQLQHLSAIQLTLLLHKVKAQAGQLDDLEREIRSLNCHRQ